MFILDSDHLSFLSREESTIGRRLQERMANLGVESSTTIIIYEEQTRGWLALLSKCRTAEELILGYRHLIGHLEVFRRIRVIEFDQPAARKFFDLKRARIRVGSMDLRIAAIALSRDATLLSRNLGDFRKVPGLKVEDWCG